MGNSPVREHHMDDRHALRRLHTVLLRRIGSTALLIALAIAALVYVLEQRRLRGVAVDLAVQRTAQFADLASDVLGAAGSVRSSEVQMRLDRFVRERLPQRDGRIVVARIYSTAGEERAHYAYAEHPQREAAAAYLSAQPVAGDVSATSGVAVDIEGVRHYSVQVPLRTTDGAIQGRVVAAYAPSPTYLAELRSRQWRAVGAAVAIVLLTTAILYPGIVRLVRRVVVLSNELLDANLEMLSVVGSAIAKRDADTDVHNFRVTIYSVRLAEALGLDTRSMRALIKGAFLHDVGKIGVPDHILLKPGKLDDTEYAEMQNHVAYGLDIVRRAAWLADAADVVGCHHEKFDGGGYGDGLKAEEIPLTARIFAIADVYDALTSRRPYKEPMSFEAAMGILQKSRGTHFDPKLLDAFSVIAPPLHETFANRDDDYPREVLRGIVVRYFKQDVEALL